MFHKPTTPCFILIDCGCFGTKSMDTFTAKKNSALLCSATVAINQLLTNFTTVVEIYLLLNFWVTIFCCK